MANITGTKYTHRFLARFVVEATTPIAIGSGEKDIFTDACVATDVNGLPYIPGSSIAGVIRSMLDPEKKDSFFGIQTKDESEGSRIIFSEGKILDSNGIPVDGIISKKDIQADKLLVQYATLPIRQHVRITEKGSAADKGKFDGQVVYAGTRFCFEVEIISDGKDAENLKTVIDTVKNCTFRLGGGTRKGYGDIRVIDVKSVELDLHNADALKLYVQKSSDLAESRSWQGWKDDSDAEMAKACEGWKEFHITLEPMNFILFGSGLGDERGNADMTTVKASKVVWLNGHGELKEQLVLVPGSSLKGALRHRTAYYYNKAKGIKAEELTDEKKKEILENNEAENALFGTNDAVRMTRGNVIFNDIIESPAPQKILQHIAVDRFTGGTLDGALFAEQVDYVGGKKYETTILVKTKGMKEEYIEAFKKSLVDLTQGMLPLGGGVNRGNGFFTGKID